MAKLTEEYKVLRRQIWNIIDSGEYKKAIDFIADKKECGEITKKQADNFDSHVYVTIYNKASNEAEQKAYAEGKERAEVIEIAIAAGREAETNFKNNL